MSRRMTRSRPVYHSVSRARMERATRGSLTPPRPSGHSRRPGWCAGAAGGRPPPQAPGGEPPRPPVLQHIAGAPDGVQERRVTVAVDLAPEVADVHVDDVALRVELETPY